MVNKQRYDYKIQKKKIIKIKINKNNIKIKK